MSTVASVGVILLGALCMYAAVVVCIILDDVLSKAARKRANPTKCPCRRRICGDTTLCDCGEAWDTNDMYPPEGH